MSQPHLTFFCELEPQALETLFRDPGVLSDLTALQAAVSLGLLDLSPERAAVVKRLNEAGIPVHAWLLLPRQQGYWFNLDNAAAAVARYSEFKQWTQEHDLKWAYVGLDIEPDMQEAELLQDRPFDMARKQLVRAFDNQRLQNGLSRYQQLVDRIRADGYKVESYQIPIIVDERRVGSKLVQRLSGLADLNVDREVLMLYTTLLPGGQAALWSYAPDARAIGVGSTGGGVDSHPKLSMDDLARDLLLAHCWTDDIYIFSLEGCVEKGFLARLRDFDWSQAVAAPFAAAGQVDRLRAGLRGALWTSTHPAVLLAIPTLIAALGLWRMNRKS